jgi:hypothetical protein
LKHEVVGSNLGDKRLDKRLARIVEALGKQPNLSIPAALGGRSEMEAGYHFFANEKVTPDKILRVHFAQTVRRVAATEVCLLVQDTTEVELTRPAQQVHGAGPMSSNAQFGAFLHPLMAFLPNGVPLGTVWQKSWARTEIQTDLTPAEKKRRRLETPLEDKESIRWVEGLRAARKVAEACPATQCVLVCDSESDIYELLAEPRTTSHGRPLEILIRACQDRATTTAGTRILDAARATPCRYTASIQVSAHQAKTLVETRKRQKERVARTTEVEVRACSVTLRPPPRPDRSLPPVTVNVVLVEEVNPPPGQDPIQWLLITTLPIATAEDIRAAVDNYSGRWGIEVYFKTLKSGCRIEERQFEFLNRELNAIAVYQIIAWRVRALCRLGRECPDLSCDVMFESSEWKAVYIIVEKKTPPKTPPRLNTMIRMIASLGGYVPRQSTEPGTQTMWIGLQRLHDFANCYDSFGPKSQMPNETCVVR